MKLIKKLGALVLALGVLVSMLAVTSGVSVFALEGAGLSNNAGYNVAFGCDVSYWNVGGDTLDYSLVNFQKMKADGCDYVILRIGYEASASRKDIVDKAFVQFYNNARAAGMDVGVYFYALATTYAGAVQDAQWVMSVIEQYDMYFEYPIYYDVEDAAQVALGSSAMESLCSGWCDTLAAAGYFPGIYSGEFQCFNKLSASFKEKYDGWVASVKTDGHGAQYDPATKSKSSVASMWQYAWYDYNYDGIGIDMLDVNVSYKDYPKIMETYGYNNMGSNMQPGTYEYYLETAANVYSDASTSSTVVDTLSQWEKVLVTDVNDEGWGKLTTPRGIVGWALLDGTSQYIGIDAMAYTSQSGTDGLNSTVNTDGSVTLENTTADRAIFDFYLPFEMNTSRTPYLSIQITPMSGNGYYFGITKAGSGYWMMRDCQSGDELVKEDEAPYMTGTEKLKIDVSYWWNPTEGYKIDALRMYVAPNSKITVDYCYFATSADVVSDTRFNMRTGTGTGNVSKNINLMNPDTISIVTTDRTGSYSYNNGMLTIISEDEEGYEVKFDINQEFTPETVSRWLIDVEARVRFDIELLVTTSEGDRTFTLNDDFIWAFAEATDEGYIPAVFWGSRGLDLYSCYTWNNIVPVDGVSTIKTVTVQVGGAGTVYVNAIQVAENDVIVAYRDGVVKADGTTASGDSNVVLESMDYTVADGYITNVSAGTIVSTFLDRVNSQYTVTVKEGAAVLANSSSVKTGSTVAVMDGNIVKATYMIVVRGDVNADGIMSTADVRVILKGIAENTLTELQKQAANYTGSGEINTAVARAMLKDLVA